jgi:hypothetical protein
LQLPEVVGFDSNMPERTFEEIAPYVNPNYWGGHSLGVGQMLEKRHDQLPMFGRQQRATKHVLKERLATMSTVIPLETYQNGDIFDAEVFENGTIVLFNKESLTGIASELPTNPNEFEELTLPSRPTNLATNFGSGTLSTFIKVEDLMYFSRSKWGVVAPSKDNNSKELHTASTSLVMKLGPQVVVSGAFIELLPTPLEIGETKHFVNPKSRRERIERVNVLEVVTYGLGDKEKQKHGLRDFAAKLALGR